MVEETKRDIYTKVTGIESRVEKDGKRLIEMEKYKLDLVELRDSIYNKQTNTLDYNRWCATVDPSDHVPMCVSRLRPSVTLPEHFYCPSTAREALLSQQRDIPAYNKVDHTLMLIVANIFSVHKIFSLFNVIMLSFIVFSIELYFICVCSTCLPARPRKP